MTVPRPPLAPAVFLRPTSPENSHTQEAARTGDRQRKTEPLVPPPLPRDGSSSRSNGLPPKEVPQEVLNKAFTDELLKAKQRLKSSQTGGSGRVAPSKSHLLQEDDEDTGGGGGGEGVPPPPPPPVLPLGMRGLKKVERSPAGPAQVNPREELLIAIRNVGGARGLRKTRD